MAFRRLERAKARREAEKAAREAARAEAAREKDRAAFKTAVREALPKSVLPKRGRGRPPSAGISPKEIRALMSRVDEYLQDEAGMERLELDVKRTALLIMLIDGLLGTEPWRAQPMLAAASRVRFVENALRLLEDFRQSSGGDAKKLVGEIIDVSPVKGSDGT